MTKVAILGTTGMLGSMIWEKTSLTLKAQMLAVLKRF